MAADPSGATIPRVPHLVPHLKALLAVLLGEGAAFESCRQTYMATAAALAAAGRGRAVASRVGQAEAYWAPTSDLLTEGMLLGLVEQQTLPSARQYIPRHADRIYRLTAEGEALAAMAADDAAFTTYVVDRVLNSHPSFRAFIFALHQAPLVLPVFDVSDIESATSVQELAERAAAEISTSGTEPVSAHQVAETIRVWTRRRFEGRVDDKPPSRKARAEVVTEACAAAALEARGIGGGPSDLKNLRAWGSNFRVTDQSRYVNGAVGPFTVWLAADLDNVRPENFVVDDAKPTVSMAMATLVMPVGPAAGLAIRRRGFAAHADAITDAVIAAYFRQAEGSALQAPYLPIHQVRAEAAFRCGVVRVLVDRVIEGLVNGTIARDGFRVELRIRSDGDHPDSEPVYSRGGSPRYSMSIARRGAEAPGGAS